MKTMRMAAPALAAVLAAGPLAAQGRCGAEGRGTMIPDLGWNSIRCTHCNTTIDSRHGLEYEFRAEPEVRSVSGVGEGRLRPGDAITAVDGHPITTQAAWDRLERARPGQQVRLTIRRDGRARDVTVTTGAHCLEPPRAPRPPRNAHPPRPAQPPQPPNVRQPAPPGQPAQAPRPPRAPHPGRVTPAPRPQNVPNVPGPPNAPQPPTPPTPPAPPEILPDGWFGFGIRCEDCGWRGRGQNASFYFGEIPTVVSVEPGTPAARAGMRRGDRLTHVDGVSLTTRDGWRRFSRIEPGQTVRWTYTRGSESRTTTMTAIRRPDARAAPTPRVAGNQLRYSGTVGGAEVEVRGAPVTVSRDPRTGELIIRSSDLTVRVSPEEKKP